MNTKKRFSPALLCALALLSLTGCALQDWSRDLFHGEDLEEKGGPLAGKTFTVAAAASPAYIDYIYWNATTSKIEIGNGTPVFDQYNPATDTAYAVLKDFLLLTGVLATDKITFDGGGLISGIEKVDTTTSPIVIKIGASGTATEIAAAAFASGVTLTQSITNGIDVTGADLAIGTALILDTATYNVYGVSIQVLAGSNAIVTQSGANELTLDAGSATATVSIAAASSITGIKLVTTALTTISNVKPNTEINVGSISGVTISAQAATTVDITGLTTIGDTVNLAAVGGARVFTLIAPALPGTDTYVQNTATGVASSSAATVNIYGTTASTFSGSGTNTGFALSVASGATTTVDRK
ncbi:hypothetical protein AGMMS49587_20030 [Spirochaetia bacterium]|nr:hypothetical protein AGMMS49587_20030 [Spirochaetia bacterium]